MPLRKKKSRFRTTLIIAILVVLLVLMFLYFDPSQNVTEIVLA